MKLQHWMTFATFAEQDYFIYPSKDTYDGIIINGNMAAHAPDGLAAFLLQKNRERIPYIIDPITHAFQHDPVYISARRENFGLQLKSSIKTLSEIFGGVIQVKAGIKPIVPSDFNPDTIQPFVANCLKFQLSHLSERMSAHEVNKYLDHKPEDLRPYCLIPPYVFLKESTYSSWLKLNTDFCRTAIEMKTEFESMRIFGAMVLDKGIISNESIIDEILAEYSKLTLDGFVVWIDDLDEQAATLSQLRGLLKLANGLRSISVSHEAINLHGGYFSILSGSEKLSTPGFTGVAHGPEFGESRAVVPVGGGIPIARYYLPHLHDRIKYGDAVNYLQQKGWLADSNLFHKEVCSCPICKSVINGDISNFKLFGEGDTKPVKRGNGFVTMQFPTKEAKLRCLKHYLQKKVHEFEFVRASEKKDLILDLEIGASEFEDILGIDGISYLRDWGKIIS